MYKWIKKIVGKDTNKNIDIKPSSKINNYTTSDLGLATYLIYYKRAILVCSVIRNRKVGKKLHRRWKLVLNDVSTEDTTRYKTGRAGVDPRTFLRKREQLKKLVVRAGKK